MYTEQTGRGPDLFLIHGWMMNLRCWDGIVARLKDRFRLTTVDLPGHGGSLRSSHSFTRPRQLVSGLLRLAPDNAVWVGWSIGGLLAQLAAQTAPDRVRSLVSVGMGSRYVASADWPYGINRALFETAARLFAVSPESTLRWLIERQLFGSERRKHVRTLMNSLAAMPWDKEELKAGLAVLRTADARGAMRSFGKPALFVAGEKDLIISVKNLEQSGRLAPRGRCVSVAGAGHAPFLSHPLEFVDALGGLIDELD